MPYYPPAASAGVTSPVATDPIEFVGAATFDKDLSMASGKKVIFTPGTSGFLSGTAGQVNVGGALVMTTDSIYFNSAAPRWAIAGLAQTTVGAAGAASAPPATPTKYLKVIDSAGTVLVIPAYAAT